MYCRSYYLVELWREADHPVGYGREDNHREDAHQHGVCGPPGQKVRLGPIVPLCALLQEQAEVGDEPKGGADVHKDGADAREEERAKAVLQARGPVVNLCMIEKQDTGGHASETG